MPLLTCTDSTGSGWTAGSLPELSSTCTRFRRSISVVCRSFGSAPGRIRTSDSRFRNAPPQFLYHHDLLANTAYLRGFQRFWRFRFPTQFDSVLARLQYGCSKMQEFRWYNLLMLKTAVFRSGPDETRTRDLRHARAVRQNRSRSP